MTAAKLFLSHAGSDTEAARQLKNALLDNPSARAAGLTVWFDKDDLPAGEHWQKQIEDAITQQATAFAVIVGSNGIINWVENEVRVALSRATGKKAIPFIPILLDNSEGSSALPPFARQFHAVREPLKDRSELEKLIRAATGLASDRRVILTDRPFVGLRAMKEADANLFFGREAEVDAVLDLMVKRSLVAIVADSGSGKSSLAQAGVAVGFRGNRLRTTTGEAPEDLIHHVVVMRPGASPLLGLQTAVSEAAASLGRNGDEKASLRNRVNLTDPAETAYALRFDLEASEGRTLLIVDQFEELFTLTPEKDRKPFVDFLLALKSGPFGIHILLTIREDHFNLCSVYPELFDALDTGARPGTYRLKRITDAGLTKAVCEPLAMTGETSADEAAALAKLIVADLPETPGALALAQKALDIVWRRRKEFGGLLEAYAGVGRVSGALANEAERIRKTIPERSDLGEDAKAMLFPLMARLLQLGETGGVTRRIAHRTEFNAPALALARHLSSSAGGRLLMMGGDTVEIAHEALFTQWPWLQGEINQAAPELRTLNRLSGKAALWKASPKDRLASGAELKEFINLNEKRREWLAPNEAELVKKSRNYKKFTEIAVTLVAAAIGALAGAALHFGFDANNQRDNAEKNRRIAEDAVKNLKTQITVADKNSSAALTALAEVAARNSPEKAAKLALAAWPKSKSSEIPGMNVTAMVFSAIVPDMRTFMVINQQNAVTSAAFSPDGRRIVTASDDGSARTWNVKTGEEVSVLKGHYRWVNSAAFSPDGKRIVTASEDGTARIWDTATDKEIAILDEHAAPVANAVFSLDGKLLVTASDDRTARIWDTATGREIAILEGHTQDVSSAAFSFDGTRIVTASWDKTARIWDAATGKEIAILEGHTNRVTSATFSPDGTRIVTSSWDNTARIWDAATAREITRLTGHEQPVISAAFSPDGTRIVTASDDKSARIWDAATGREITRLTGHEETVWSAAFSPDGTRIVTASWDKSARIWDAATAREITPLNGHTNHVSSAEFSPDGKRIVTASWDKTSRIWDMSGVPKGTIFDVACARLPIVDGKKDTSLEQLGKDYGLILNQSICVTRPPIPVLPWKDGLAELTDPPPLDAR